jgi:hypothetical protein
MLLPANPRQQHPGLSALIQGTPVIPVLRRPHNNDIRWMRKSYAAAGRVSAGAEQQAPPIQLIYREGFPSFSPGQRSDIL